MKYRKYTVVSIMRVHNMLYWETKVDFADAIVENQISLNLRLIEVIQVFEIVKIITDIKLIHATHLIFSVAVKSESRKIWPPTIKKGKSMFQIHPFE